MEANGFFYRFVNHGFTNTSLRTGEIIQLLSPTAFIYRITIYASVLPGVYKFRHLHSPAAVRTMNPAAEEIFRSIILIDSRHVEEILLCVF